MTAGAATRLQPHPLLRSQALERGKQTCAVGTAKTGAGVPTGSGLVSAVIPFRDVAQNSCPQALVQRRVKESHRLGQSLIQTRDQSGPERSRGTGSANGLH